VDGPGPDGATPLFETTFTVVDLETTGGSPQRCAITEVGAVKLRGGECVASLQTLVNPGVPVPPTVTYLTGITEATVLAAPPVAAVLPSLLELVGDSVVVGHNVRFDLAFLNASLRASGRPPLANPSVDTAGLARRLLRHEVTDNRLATLARYLRLEHRPTHRALDDARATGELLHRLLERAGTIGIFTLGDLLELPTMAAHPQAHKIALTARLPATAGVYRFKNAAGHDLFVAAASDVRRAARSHFTSDNRRQVGPVLRQLHSIEHEVCTGELEAAVRAERLVARLRPALNRRQRDWRRYAYLKATLGGRVARLGVARAVRAHDAGLYLGPLPSSAAARRIAEAIGAVFPIHLCPAGRASPSPADPSPTGRPGRPACRACLTPVSDAEQAEMAGAVAEGLAGRPDLLLAPLRRHALDLIDAGRPEDAARLGEGVALLAEALLRQERIDALRRMGRFTVLGESEGAVVDGGKLVHAWRRPGSPPSPTLDRPPPPPNGPASREEVDEILTIADWLRDHEGRVTVLR
jgi:DNA polymerase-3 subunit epsilon